MIFLTIFCPETSLETPENDANCLKSQRFCPCCSLTLSHGHTYSVAKWWQVVVFGFLWTFAKRFGTKNQASGDDSVFRGVQHINMDAKGRLAMPARQREPLMSHCAGKIVVTIDTKTSCLQIYPLPEWERLEQEIQSMPAMKPAVKRFQRLVLGYATDLELDSNGRILLPAPLREHAKLEKKLVLLGQVNKLELWSEELWVAERDQALLDSCADEDEIPEELIALNM